MKAQLEVLIVKIDEVCEAVFRKHRAFLRKTEGSSKYPKFAIYMTPEFFRECMKEIQGSVTSMAIEFHTDQTIVGYPVWVAVSRSVQRTHEPWVIVDLNLDYLDDDQPWVGCNPISDL